MISKYQWDSWNPWSEAFPNWEPLCCRNLAGFQMTDVWLPPWWPALELPSSPRLEGGDLALAGEQRDSHRTVAPVPVHRNTRPRGGIVPSSSN